MESGSRVRRRPHVTTPGAARRWLALAALASMPAIAACAGEDDAQGHDSSVIVAMNEFDFVSDAVPVVRAGDTVRFVADNVGRLIHEIQVLDSDAQVLGRTDRVMPGDRDEVTVRFDRAGIYQLICDVDDHLTLGQRALFEVLTADGDSILDS